MSSKKKSSSKSTKKSNSKTEKKQPKKELEKKAQPKEKPTLIRSSGTKRLQRILTDQEKLERLEVFHKASFEASDLTADKKRVIGQADEEIKRKQAVAAEAMAEIRYGTYEDIETQEQLDFEAGEVRTVRIDTWELLETRLMLPEDRQTKLPLEETKKTPETQPVDQSAEDAEKQAAAGFEMEEA